MSKVRCDKCRGEKHVMGMGAMKQKCTGCKGTGFVEEKDSKRKSKG